MEKPTVDALARRFEALERENRRWKCVAGIAALGLAGSLALGGLLGPRAAVGQPPEEAGSRPPRRWTVEYKVTDVMPLNQMDKPLRDLAADGREVQHVIPTE